MKNIQLCFLYFILFFLLPKAFAADFYVSAQGSGNQNGTSVQDSWAINNINWFKVNPGDNIYICGMIRSPLTIKKSGESGYPITIRGDCPGNAGTLNGANPITNPWTLVSSNVYSTTVPFVLNSSKFGLVL